MRKAIIKKAKSLKGSVIMPADKSISHRAIMVASIAKGKSRIKNFLHAEDPISTICALKSLGIEIERLSNGDLIVVGKGLYGLKEPSDIIDCGNSGTTIRLLSGILSGNPFLSILTGDDSLRQRPMARIMSPLKQMGVSIFGRQLDKYPPIVIKGGALNQIKYTLPIASAQVKSCLILAGIYAQGITEIIEPSRSRDHTERMLKSIGAEIKVDGLSITIEGKRELKPFDITVPADFSSAAFFISACLIVPNSEILIKNVGINPTRTGFLRVIESMGANVVLKNKRNVSGELISDIYCKSGNELKAIKIGGDLIPSLIDEFPILSVLATQVEGATEIRDAEELRIKESDRIKAMATELRKMGVELEEYPDGIAIFGKAQLKGAIVESYNDHRIAMALSVAGLITKGRTTINNADCINISFPDFWKVLEKIRN